MVKGDVSIYSDNVGGEHVAIVTDTHEDGSVDLAVLKTSLRAVPRSATKVGGTFFDPSWVNEVPVAPAIDPGVAGPGLSSVPLPQGDVEQPEETQVEAPAHGAPTDVTPPESA